MTHIKLDGCTPEPPSVAGVLIGHMDGWGRADLGCEREADGNMISRYGCRLSDIVGFITSEPDVRPSIVILLRSGHSLEITFATWTTQGDSGQAFSDFVEALDRELRNPCPATT